MRAAALPTAKMYGIILAVGPFALTFLILIVMHFLGVPLFPRSVFGKRVRRLSHYSKIDKKNLTYRWNEKMLSKLKQKDEIKVIYGEGRGWRRIEAALALKRDLSVEAIIGQNILNKDCKEEFVRLMKKYPDELSVYMLPERPERHASLIGSHFLLEDPHPYNEPYKTAIVVENASKELISHFKTRFEEMKEKAKRATVSDIQKMGVYES